MVEVEGANALQPACVEVNEGMKIKTNNKRVRNARKTVLELLLGDHPGNVTP